MTRIFSNTLAGIAVIATAGIVSACLGDTQAQTTPTPAGSDVSQAEFDALLARVAALEANQPGDKVFAAGGSSSSIAKAAAAGGRPLGTMVGHLPADVAVSRSQFFSLKSPAGYLYAVPNGRTTDGRVAIASYAGDSNTGGRYVYFGTPDCSSFPIVPGTDVSDYGASQGLVFRIGAGEFNEVIDNPAQYFYIPAGSERGENSSYSSRMSRVGFCEAASGILSVGYVALPNDAAVTGVESAPVDAPVTLADPA
jgi:hypothetical protein